MDKSTEVEVVQIVEEVVRKMKYKPVSTYRKMELLLYKRKRFNDSVAFKRLINDDRLVDSIGDTDKYMKIVDYALDYIRDDQYSEIIGLYYFEGYTTEAVAEYIGRSTRTVLKNKKKLVNKMKDIVFSSEVIGEICG